MIIAPSVVDELIAHARASQPEECCGILLGRADRIVGAVRGRNLAETRATRFLLDPRDHIGALRRARAEHLDVVGFYHSHPASEPYPSPTDVAEATYPDAVHLIVGLRRAEPEVRAFRIANGVIERLELTTLR